MEPARKRRNREHTNSRNGCAQCKARKVKCDEEKPICRACTRRSTACTYSNDGLDQLAHAASAASSPYEHQDQSFRFTPIQSEVGPGPFNNNSVRSEPFINFTPIQQEFRTITPKNETIRATNTPLRATPVATASRAFSLTLNMGQLELLHHFIAVTSSAISAGTLGFELWHMTIPKIALSHDWLMHSILAVSALHIAHLNPEQQRLYWRRAVVHQDQALQGQQKALANPTRENGDALFAFSLVIIYLAFASLKTLETAEDAPLEGVIRCLHMLGGMRAIAPAVRHYVEEGPLAPLLHHHPGNIKSNPTFREAGTESHFSKLLVFASTNADLNDDQDMNDTESFAAAASSLRASYLKVEAIPEGQPMTPPIWHWAVRLPASFVTRLREGHCVPLILVAHWCVLLVQVQHYWFIQGWVDQTMGDLTRCLAQEYREWLDWPNERILEIRRVKPEIGG